MVINLSSPPIFLLFFLWCVVVFFVAGDGGAVVAEAALDAQAAYLSQMKQEFAGPAMARWDFSAPAVDYCKFQGVGCDASGNVTAIDVTSWRLSGRLPGGVCEALPPTAVAIRKGIVRRRTPRKLVIGAELFQR